MQTRHTQWLSRRDNSHSNDADAVAGFFMFQHINGKLIMKATDTATVAAVETQAHINAKYFVDLHLTFYVLKQQFIYSRCI